MGNYVYFYVDYEAMNCKNKTGKKNIKIFDLRAEKYNTLNWVFDNEFSLQILSIANPRFNDKVLDLGTGTGSISKIFQDKVKNVYAIDSSKMMLAKAKALLKKNVILSLEDGQHLSFKSNFFDLVLCRNALHHFDNPILGLKEISRVLNSKGYFILVEPIAPDSMSKDLWSKIFMIRDKGRNPIFYFTTKELVSFINRHCFISEKIENIIIPMQVANWLDTGCVSDFEKRQVYEIIEQVTDEVRIATGIHEENNLLVIDNQWAIIKFKKINEDEK